MADDRPRCDYDDPAIQAKARALMRGDLSGYRAAEPAPTRRPADDQ